MQREQPQFYANLAGHLSAEDQGMVQAIMAKADEIEAQQQAQLMAQQQQGQMAGDAAPAN